MVKSVRKFGIVVTYGGRERVMSREKDLEGFTGSRNVLYLMVGEYMGVCFTNTSLYSYVYIHIYIIS